ncbi:hypothetical protein D3C73_1339050 [compost metagenome]
MKQIRLIPAEYIHFPAGAVIEADLLHLRERIFTVYRQAAVGIDTPQLILLLLERNPVQTVFRRIDPPFDPLSRQLPVHASDRIDPYAGDIVRNNSRA